MLRLVCAAIIVLLCAVLLEPAWLFMMIGRGQTSSAMGWRMDLFNMSMAVLLATLMVFAVIQFAFHSQGTQGFRAARERSFGKQLNMELLLLGASFVVGLIIGLPVAVTLGVSSLLYILVVGLPLAVIPQKMYAGMDSFVLLSIPGFILAGNLMNHGGITVRIVRFANAVRGLAARRLGTFEYRRLHAVRRHFRNRGGRRRGNRRRDDPRHEKRPAIPPISRPP